MRSEKDNEFNTFDDWLSSNVDGMPNASLLKDDDWRVARSIWTHGFEAGYHEGHVDGWGLAKFSNVPDKGRA